MKHRDGFRGALARAIRCEEPTHDEYNDEHGTTITTATTTTATRFVDWSSHTVDYPRFKKRLQFFARRRSQIRAMIRNSTDQRLSEQVLVDLLGPKTAFPVRQKGWEKNQHPQQAQEQQQQTANNNNNINSNEYDNAIQNQHQHSHNNYTNHMYASMPDDDDDHPNNVPLSCNLSMDPHSHIGMGGDTSAERSVVVREGGPPSSVTFPSSNTTTDNTKTAIGNRNNPRRFQNHNYNNSTNNNNAPTNYAAAATAPHHYVAMPGGGAASSHNTLAFGGGPPAMMIGDSGSTVEEGSQSSSASNATSSKNNTNHNSKNVPRHGVDDQFPPPKRRTQRSIMRRLSVSERNEIILFLEWEMDKALMFYLSQWQKLSHRLERLQRLRHEQQQHKRQQHQSYRPPTTTPATRPEDDHWAPVSLLPTSLDESPLTPDPTIEEDDDNENGDPNNDDECGFVHDAALEDEILELFCFCVTNIITVQQILVRYDAFARAFEGTPMLNFFMKKVTKYPTSFRKILYHEELHAIANFYQDHHSTTTTTTTGTSSSHNNNNAIAASVASSGAATASETTTSATSLLNRQQMEFAAQRQYLAEILDSIQSAWSMNGATNSAAAQNISHTDACLYAMRKLFLVGLFEDRLGLEPAYLTSRGQSLTNEMEHIALWRKNKRTRRNNNNNNLLNMNDMKHSKRKEKKLSSMQQFHLALNLVAAFLYCMNYYVRCCCCLSHCLCCLK